MATSSSALSVWPSYRLFQFKIYELHSINGLENAFTILLTPDHCYWEFIDLFLGPKRKVRFRTKKH